MRPLLLNTLSFWLWALALVSLGLFAVTATQRMQADLERREDARFRASTQQAMELWERQTLDAAATWLTSFEEAKDLAAFELRARREIPWVDAFYLWDTRDDRVIHPQPVTAPLAPGDLECLSEVERTGPVLSGPALAMSYLACLPAPPAVEILVTRRASSLLQQAGKLVEAERALYAGHTPPGLSLREGIQRDIPPASLAQWRLQQMTLRQAAGVLQEARDEAVLLGAEIADLAGADLDVLLEECAPAVLAIVQDLGSSHELAQLERDLERAERRHEAWLEVKARLSRRADLPGPGERPQLLRDPYTTPPYLLLSRHQTQAHLAAAVQVDETELVDRLLQVVEEGYGARITVEDGAGRHLAGPTTRSVQGQLTFPLTFEYLRVGLVSSTQANDPDRRRLMLIQLLPIGLTVLLGTLALLARAAAIRRRLELEKGRSEFVTRVTHELKTPLAGIRVMAEVLELGAYRDEDERAELAQRILKESQRLAKRVDEVLDMARAPADFSLAPTDLEDLCAEVADRWADLMKQNDIALELDIRPLPIVRAQHALIRDALGALLENAIKYRDPTRPSRVKLIARPAGRRWVIFEVVDNGIGVPPAKRRMIFEPFARVEGPGRGMAGGHGLGLSFVANAARVHHGRAECREGIDGGCRFILRIRRG
jgi:signal transduction histidine kinase